MNASGAILAVSGFRGSSAEHAIDWPGWGDLLRVLLLSDYNTRVVVIGTTLLGLAAGVIGTFMLLRKRALMGDALSHATLPGIAIAFVVMTLLGQDGKWLPGLLLGALISGTLGMLAVLLIRHGTRIKEDAALGIVLSVFFGLGIAVLGLIQRMSTGNAAGLQAFIYGKPASMLASDAQLIAVAAAVITVACVLLFKEFKLLCFDADYGKAQGWPVMLMDMAMMGLVCGVTVIGLQAVGLILIIAMLIIPAAAARFWTEGLLKMVLISAGIGAASGMLGAALSALLPGLPAGAIIVLVASALFVVSMLVGTSRGILPRALQRRVLARQVGRQNLLRAIYEVVEDGRGTPLTQRDLSWEALLAARSWSGPYLRRLARRAQNEGLLHWTSSGTLRLTDAGEIEARRVVRNHRLWEMYLITHADVAPGNVDRGADLVEHVLGQPMVARLERLLTGQDTRPDPLRSPHQLTHAPPGEAGLTAENADTDQA